MTKPKRIPATILDQCLDPARVRRQRGIRETKLLLNGLLACVPDAKFIGVWAREGSGYVLVDSSIAGHPDRGAEDALRRCRVNVGLEVRPDGSVSEDLSGVRLNSWCPFGKTAREEARWFHAVQSLVFQVSHHNTDYLLEFYAGRWKKESVHAGDLRSRAERFIHEGFLEQSDQGASETPDDARSLRPMHEIRENLLRRLQHDYKQTVNELHLFVADPDDEMLYYGATDHLSLSEKVLDCVFQTTAGKSECIRWKLEPLPSRMQDYVKGRLAALDAGDQDLVALYDSITQDGFSREQIVAHEAALKSILQCLPQECEAGVAGEAYTNRTLAISRPRSEERRWDVRQNSGRFFAQKLALEQLFGVASSGSLVAMPIFDGPQVAGALFIVKEGPPTTCEKLTLLELAEEASRQLALYRLTSFERSVTNELQALSPVEMSTIVAERFGDLLLHQMLITIRTGASGHHEIDRVWAPVFDYCRHECTRELGEPQLAELCCAYASVQKQGGIGLIKLDLNSAFATRISGRTGIVLQFHDNVDFFLVVKEHPDAIRRAPEKLQTIVGVLTLVAEMHRAFARADQRADALADSIFSSHELTKRYCLPMYSIGQAIEALKVEQESQPDAHDLAMETKLLATRMEGQIATLKRDPREKSELAKVGPLDLTAILTHDVRFSFRSLLRGKDDSWQEDPYSEHVQLDTTLVEPGLFVRGRRHDLVHALTDILENTLKDYGLGLNLILKHPDRRAVEVAACRDSADFVRITVRDYGHGIDKSKADELNARFDEIVSDPRGYADKLVKRTRENLLHSGLGLHHAPQVFARMRSDTDAATGGRMEIAPAPPHGTCVKIYLPALDRNKARVEVLSVGLSQVQYHGE